MLLDVYISYAALYFADAVGFTPAQVGLMMGALMAAGLAANVALIPLLERVPGRRLVRLTAVLAGLAYAAWLLVPWIWAKIILAILVRLLTLGWYEVLSGRSLCQLAGPLRNGCRHRLADGAARRGAGLVRRLVRRTGQLASGHVAAAGRTAGVINFHAKA